MKKKLIPVISLLAALTVVLVIIIATGDNKKELKNLDDDRQLLSEENPTQTVKNDGSAEIESLKELQYVSEWDFYEKCLELADEKVKPEIEKYNDNTSVSPRNIFIAMGIMTGTEKRITLDSAKEALKEINPADYQYDTEYGAAVNKAFVDIASACDKCGGSTSVYRRYYINDEGTEYIEVNNNVLVYYVNTATNERIQIN